jgi:sugar phosphate isomerase/epimerase
MHAPHFMAGVNLAKRGHQAANVRMIGEAQKFADRLGAEKIIVHPGIDGDIDETVRQINLLNEPRLLVENKPYQALNSDLLCNGASPAEIKLVLDSCRVGFCLDIGHALCAARAFGSTPDEIMAAFTALKPEMFHITDGDVNSVRDSHLHIGRGNYDFRRLFSFLPAGARLTVETDKDSRENLSDYEEDVRRLREYDN